MWKGRTPRTHYGAEVAPFSFSKSGKKCWALSFFQRRLNNNELGFKLGVDVRIVFDRIPKMQDYRFGVLGSHDVFLTE